MTVAQPYLSDYDNHTLAEIWVSSADLRQAVEFGWLIDRQVNGDTRPHLFVYHWVNGTPTCYNGCGYVATAFPLPGFSWIPTTGSWEFGLEHADGRWYVGYNFTRIGYFPDNLWGNTFTSGSTVAWYGEVASARSAPCTDMGNGKWPSDTSAANINMGYFNGPPVQFTSFRDNAALYSVRTVNSNNFRYGGSGAC